MNQYVTGGTIKHCREKRGLTQSQLADILNVSNKTISKWETGNGYPDITLLEPLAQVLGISMIELLSGNEIINSNRHHNILRSKIYVCPICGNVVYSVGDTLVSCCGIVLPALEAETPDAHHAIQFDLVEDDYYITIDHPMTKDHHISFIGCLTDDGFQFIKLYPEGDCAARFRTGRVRQIFYYCNHHSLYSVKVNRQLPIGEKIDA